MTKLLHHLQSVSKVHSIETWWLLRAGDGGHFPYHYLMVKLLNAKGSVNAIVVIDGGDK